MTGRILVRALGPIVVLLGTIVTGGPARATFPGLDGRIAFSTDVSNHSQIFSVNPDGSDQRQLTHVPKGHGAFGPDWSPDGALIAFSSDLTGNAEIYEMNSDGAGQTRLTTEPGFDHFSPRYSPDGTEIAFNRCGPRGCAIYEMSATGGAMTRLSSKRWNSFNPEFSPDGSKIAFDSDRGGLFSAVWVMNADGSNARRLTDPDLEALYPDWSPDGGHILFTGNCCRPHSNVWVMNADGSGLKQLTHFPTKHQGGFASYSPGGDKIVLFSDLEYRDACCNDLYTMNANGTGLSRIVSDQPGVFISDWGSSP